MFRLEVAPGLELRQFEPRDANAAFAAVTRLRPYLREWLPWVDETRSALDIRSFIARAVTQYEEGHGPQAGIWLDGALVGSVGCHPIDWANRSCSIGYWLDAACQGRGIMTRCCTAMLDYLVGDVRLHRVEIRCGVGNVKSCAIPRRLGFVREGVVREAEWVNDRWVDLVVWGMLAQDWEARKSAG
jgi:ribosomal-protein-serine acetyltransferase